MTTRALCTILALYCLTGRHGAEARALLAALALRACTIGSVVQA